MGDDQASRKADGDRRPAPATDWGGSERRAWPRYSPLNSRGWLGWWADGDFDGEPARLLDISGGGAAVEADRAPPPDCPVFFALDGPGPTGVAEAEVVGVRPGRGRQYLIHLAFTAGCPERLLRAARFGPRADPPGT